MMLPADGEHSAAASKLAPKAQMQISKYKL